MKDPKLQGVHAPVTDELDVDLAFEGRLPRGLRGRYLRNGPNPAFEPKGRYHMFDGDGMIHALDFEEGRVRYRNRWVRTAALEIERREGRSLYGGLTDANPPGSDVLREGESRMKNPANTNIIRHAGRHLALWEGGQPTALTAELDTIGLDDFAGALAGPMTAHPRIDPVDGKLLFFGYSPFPPYLRYHEVDASGKLVRSVEIDLPNPIMIHDFLVTREHVVFFDSPAVFDFEHYASGGGIIHWKPEAGTRLGIMPRDGEAADLQWFEIPTAYVFHFLNAWTEDDRVHVFGTPSPWLGLDFENDTPPEGLDTDTYLHEWTVDLSAGRVSTRRIGETPGEFCKVADAVGGVKHRYGYLASFSHGRCDGGYFDGLTKFDLELEREANWFEPGAVIGEAAFAPDQEDSSGAEDAGWVVAYAHYDDGARSEFIVIDARDFEAGPIARIPMPRRVPFGFHGNWMTPED
jgi:carotenoid cleavage dioxygenase